MPMPRSQNASLKGADRLMLTTCGSPISSYYSKVKLALLEKGVAFTEELVPIMSKSESVLADSPLGKIPQVRTPHGGLCGSQATMVLVSNSSGIIFQLFLN